MMMAPRDATKETSTIRVVQKIVNIKLLVGRVGGRRRDFSDLILLAFHFLNGFVVLAESARQATSEDDADELNESDAYADAAEQK
jgi:hypothetical protein